VKIYPVHNVRPFLYFITMLNISNKVSVPAPPVSSSSLPDTKLPATTSAASASSLFVPKSGYLGNIPEKYKWDVQQWIESGTPPKNIAQEAVQLVFNLALEGALSPLNADITPAICAVGAVAETLTCAPESKEVAKLLGEVLKTSKSLKRLVIDASHDCDLMPSLARGLEGNTTLTHLAISKGNSSQQGGIGSLLETINENRNLTLTHLAVTECQLNDNDMQDVGIFLSENHTLTHLNFSLNKRETVKGVARFCDGLTSNASLTHFECKGMLKEYEDTEFFYNAIRRNGTLLTVDADSTFELELSERISPHLEENRSQADKANERVMETRMTFKSIKLLPELNKKITDIQKALEINLIREKVNKADLSNFELDYG
jgi:hypothetical protein